MNPNEKKKILATLSEKEFRQGLIIPLLSKMGYIAPIEYHGTNEKGKDIVCFEYDKLREQSFLAVVAKIDDLTGDVSKDSGLMNVCNQVRQAFDYPYEDLFNMRQLFINQVWVVTTGKIVSGAQESVIRSLRKSNLDKQIRIFGGDRVIQLVDEHFSTYWNSSAETKESVIIQRDRLLSFVEDIFSANGVDKTTINEVKSAILYSHTNPIITTGVVGLSISHVSPYSIELSRIDSEYDDYIHTQAYGITKEIFREAKKHLSYSFMDIVDVMDEAERISKISNPREFVNESKDHLIGEYPFTRSFGSASNFVDAINIMDEGLDELEYFKEFLSHRGKHEWAKALSSSILTLRPEIENILENSQDETVTINYIIDEDDDRVKIEYDETSTKICFSRKYKRVDTGGVGRNRDGSLKVEEVVNWAFHDFRKYLEDELDYDIDDWLEKREE